MSLLHQDLFSFALFVRICEARSITRAAEQLNVAVSAASRRVSILEHTAGMPLLVRKPHGVEPTTAGFILLRYAREVLHLGQMLESSLDEHRSGTSGHIRVFASSSVLVECLAAHLSEFGRENPRIKLDLEERPSADTLEALQRKQADIGVVVSGGDMSGLATFPYASDRLAVALPKGHQLSGSPRLRFADLFEDDHIALERGTAVHRLIAEKAHAYGRQPRIRVQVRSFEVMCQMISKGLGIGVLPMRAVGPLAGALGLELIVLDEPWAERKFTICVQSPDELTAPAKRLVDFLTAQSIAGSLSL